MIGGGFQHEICSSAGHTPQDMEWVKDGSASCSIHIDQAIFNQGVDKSKKNYAWLAESKTIHIDLYEKCKREVGYVEENFELLFTHDVELTRYSDKFKLVLCSALPWVKNTGIGKKTKLVSMIASTKIMCDEHRYRQQIASKYKNEVDLFGRGYRYITDKDIGLKEYMFSISMENGTYPLMLTEKLTDCFISGTIPIYYGTGEIGQIFNRDGIIMLDDNFNIEDIHEDLYRSKIDAIKDNFEITCEMQSAEDHIYNKFLKHS